MRLTELDPRWFTFAHPADGVDIRIGLTFLCPHCRVQRLGVAFTPAIDPAGMIPKFGIQLEKMAWQRQGDTFDTLTITPSIDASHAATMGFEGHWHGYITSGEIQ